MNVGNTILRPILYKERGILFKGIVEPVKESLEEYGKSFFAINLNSNSPIQKYHLIESFEQNISLYEMEKNKSSSIYTVQWKLFTV